MKKDVNVILVPKDKCPLDVLADMQERIRNSWIFLHRNAVNKLRETADETREIAFGSYMCWKGTDEYPSTLLTFDSDLVGTCRGVWSQVTAIIASDINFASSLDPKYIYFLKMEVDE